MTLQDMLDQVNIAEYISQYIELEEHNGELWGLSCFKEENTPSFSVNPEKNVFKDFSSGKSGNIINFIMKYHSCGIADAINKLKDWLGISEELSYSTLPIVKELRKYKPKSHPVKKNHIYLDSYEFNKYETIPIQSWNDEGITDDICRKYQIQYDPRKLCITIPVWDNDGRLINILCRTTDPQSEEKRIPKYVYRYKLGELDFFWGWHQHIDAIKQTNQVILVEGTKSVLKLELMGYENAVAVLTSHLGDDQLRVLISHGFDCVFMLDKNVNPRTDPNIQHLQRFCKVYIAEDHRNLLSLKDSPCDKGKEVFEQIYTERRRLR